MQDDALQRATDKEAGSDVPSDVNLNVKSIYHDSIGDVQQLQAYILQELLVREGAWTYVEVLSSFYTCTKYSKGSRSSPLSSFLLPEEEYRCAAPSC